MRTIEEKIANAIKWIDALKPEAGFKKTVNKLKKTYNPKSISYDFLYDEKNKDETRYCCLGVACEVLNREIKVGQSSERALLDEMGLREEEGQFQDVDGEPIDVYAGNGAYRHLTTVNDACYRHDDDFTNMRKFIIDNLEAIFVNDVAVGLRQYYGK